MACDLSSSARRAIYVLSGLCGDIKGVARQERWRWKQWGYFLPVKLRWSPSLLKNSLVHSEIGKTFLQLPPPVTLYENNNNKNTMWMKQKTIWAIRDIYSSGFEEAESKRQDYGKELCPWLSTGTSSQPTGINQEGKVPVLFPSAKGMPVPRMLSWWYSKVPVLCLSVKDMRTPRCSLSDVLRSLCSTSLPRTCAHPSALLMF